jgi:signal transduction histidine kinase
MWLLLGLVLSDVYLFTALAAAHGYVVPIPLFLPAAVILATLVLIPPHRWALPLVTYYGYLIMHGILRGNPPGYMLTANVADVIAPVVGVLLLRRFIPGTLQFNTLTSVSGYVAAVSLGVLLGATWASTVRVFIGAPFVESWSRWFFSELLASLAVAPMILLWVHAGRAGLRISSRARLVEIMALGGAWLVLAWLQLSTNDGVDTGQATFLRYLPVPLLVWAAVRFGPRGLMTVLSMVLVLSIAVAAKESAFSSSVNVVTLQVFLLTVGVPLFVLAALVQERQEAGVRLEQSEERYRAVVGNLPHGAVLLFDPELRHFFADGQGLPELGLAKGDIEGKALAESFSPELAKLLEPHYRAALDGAQHSFDLVYQGRTYQAEVLPVTTVDRPSGMLLLQDVTHERLVPLLAAANEQLERVNRARSERVFEVTHELRTPLSSIQAFSELIRDEQLHVGEMKEFSGYINQEALRLGRLVSDLLDLESINSGRLTLHLQLLDLNGLVEEVVGNYRWISPRHDLRLELDPAVAPIMGDRDRLAQVAVNLVSNAFKYSPEGGQVTVGTAHEGHWVHLWVRDQGLGIAPENLEQIFTRYTRVAPEHYPAIQGVGLGLPIVRHLAELHGGRVWAESELGRGSNFHLVLPLSSEATDGLTQSLDLAQRSPLI